MKKFALLALSLTAVSHAQQPTLTAEERLAFMAAGVNFVPDVTTQFAALSTRPDALGFYMDGSPNPSRCKHYQGMVRYQGADGTPYFLISRSGNIPAIPYLPDGVSCGQLDGGDDDDPGNLIVIEMNSREKHGERMRSNRIRRGIENADTPPSANDYLIANIEFNGSNGWPNYGHPGGMQIVGNILAVPMETPYDDAPEARILFIDVGNPFEPELRSHFDPGVEDMKAGLVGITPQASGKFLMLISGGTNDTIWFYESVPNNDNGTPDDASDDFTEIESPDLEWVEVDVWTTAIDGPDVGAEWPTGGGAHQSLTFLREGDINGPLYVAGARNTVTLQYFGSDNIDLYRVTRTGNDFKLVRQATSHKNTHPNSDGSITLPESPFNDAPTTANFAAASTFYVSPTGDLLFYATEHDNDGATEFPLFGGTIKSGEWRHVEMARPGSPTRSPTAIPNGPYSVDEGSSVAVSGTGAAAISQAWIQLYSNRNFEDRYLVIDYKDWAKDNFDDFKDIDGDLLDTKLGFDNIPSSWRWFAPVGCTVRANDDSFGDSDFPGANTRTLEGLGIPQSAADLRDVCNDGNRWNSDGTPRDCSDNNGQMDDEITSAQFGTDCDVYYSLAPTLAWDIDLDGVPDTYDSSATFSAANLDGPSTIALPLFAIHPVDLRQGRADAVIDVKNVAPMVDRMQLMDDLGQVIGESAMFAIAGLDITFNAEFSDAGQPDTHQGVVSWGDGTTTPHTEFANFLDSTGGVTGIASASNFFGVPGTFTVTFDIEDDDFGSAQESVALEVLSISQALQSVVELINSMIEASNDQELIAGLTAVRNALIGNNGGAAENGAIDAYDAGRLKTSLVKLDAVLIKIEVTEAATGIDLSAARNTVGLAAKSMTVNVYTELLALAADFSPGQLAKLDAMQEAIAVGNLLLQQGDVRGALGAYHDALP